MVNSKALRRSILTAIAAALLISPVKAKAEDGVVYNVHNPVYSENGATWDETGEFIDDKRDFTDWSYVYFGSYPQSEVTDQGVIASIDEKLGADVTGDVEIGDAKYRKVSKADANTDEVEWGEATYRYFLWEPLKWKVLKVDTENDKLFILADQCVDAQEFFEGSNYIYWSKSMLRKWLKAGDYNDPDRKGFTGNSFGKTAFTQAQRDAILLTKVTTNNNPVYEDIPGGPDTEDYIFLLSYEEVTNPEYGFNSYHLNDTTSRMVGYTDYAGAMGVSEKNEWNGLYWWLRSPGGDRCSAMACRGSDGWVYRKCHALMCGAFGVVPAMNLQLSSNQWSVNRDGSDPGIHIVGYTITFDGNGGALDESNVITDEAGKVKFPTVTREGYTLKGWFTDKEGGVPVTEDTVFTKPMTLYARWEKIEIKTSGKTVTAPARVKIKAKNKKAGRVLVKVKSPKADGYEVVYATKKKKLSKAKKPKKSTAKRKITLKKLKKGKKYFIKARAYNVDADGNKVYGKWSKVKKVKVKK